jgi:WD40 repeat protein
VIRLLHPTAPPPDHSESRLNVEGLRGLAVGGERAFALCAEGTLRCLSLPDGRLCWERPDGGHLVAASPCGQRLVVVGRGGSRVLDAASGDAVEEHALGFAPVALGLTPAGEPLVASRAGVVCALRDGVWRRQWAFDEAVAALALGAAGELVVAFEDGRVECWSASRGPQPLPGSMGTVRALAIRGERVFAAGDDRLIHRWSLAGDEQQTPLAGHQRPVLGLGFDAHGRLWSGGRDQRLRVWDPHRAAPYPALSGHGGGVRACLVAGERGFTGGRDGMVLAWSLASGRPREPWWRGRSGITAMALGPSGGLVVGHSDGSLQRLTSPSQSAWRQRRAHDGPVACLGVLDSLVISGGADGSLRVWDLATGAPVSARLDHGSRLRCLALSPDGALVATGGYDGSLVLAPALAGSAVARGRQHEGPVVGCAWAGERVVTVGMDGALRCWSVEGALLGSVQAHEHGAVGVVAVDERRAVSVGGDGRLCCYELDGDAPRLVDAIDLGVPLDGLGHERRPGGGTLLLVGDRFGGAHALALEP